MTSELDDLYREIILDHYKAPRNFGVLEKPDHRVEGNNPLCGDRFFLTVKMRGNIIEDLRFTGSGCAISTASASLMSECVKGKTANDAQALFESFHAMVTTGTAEAGGKLAAFAGVRQFPIRVKCATLAWHTLKAALDGGKDLVSTE